MGPGVLTLHRKPDYCAVQTEGAAMGRTSGREDPADAGDERVLDAGTAVRLLEGSRRAAERELGFRSPWLTAIAAVAVLVAFGAAWVSVLGQHPYRGPTWVALVVLLGVVLIRVVTVAVAHRRARAGVSGRSVRRERAEAAVVGAALVAVYAVMVALAVGGADDAVVYGLYVPTATLLVLGALWAARSAVLDDRAQLLVGLGLMLVATVSAFAGPYGVWLSDGIGCCAVLLALGLAQ